MQEQDPPISEKPQSKIPQNEITEQTGASIQPVEKDIDLNAVFPDEKTDLNTLFPDLEMKRFLKKIKRNKKELREMTRGFVEETGTVEPQS